MLAFSETGNTGKIKSLLMMHLILSTKKIEAGTFV